MSGATDSPSTRRRFLAATSGALAALAGCQDATTPRTSAQSTTATTTTSTRGTTTDRRTETGVAETGPDIAATYALRHGEWGECLSGTPADGRYERVTEAVADRHATAFREAGIGRVRTQLPPGETGRRRLAPLLSASTATVDVHADLVRLAANDEYRSRVAALATTADELDAVTGLVVPVVALRQDSGAAARQTLRERHDSLPGFVDWLRTQLPETRLVAQVGMPGPGYFEKFSTFYAETVPAFDAVTNAVWPPAASDQPWTALQTALLTTYRALRTYAREHDVEFEPAVAPGLPTGVRACDESSPRGVPRDPREYERALRLALRYATGDRVTVASFNDWRQGTQLEPGTYDGREYGASYLTRTRAVYDDPPSGLDRETYYVSPDGRDTGAGSRDDPFETIQHALTFAGPGTTVHLLPGDYYQDFETVRSGTPDNPIKITGPRSAVIRGAGSRESGIIANVWHSHIHITGCTFNGLWRPDRPDDPESYRPYIMFVRSNVPDYQEDVRVLPHAVGNARNSFINFDMVNHVEVGEFEVIGPAGAEYALGDAVDHEGEIVYIGTPPNATRNLQEEGLVEGAVTAHDYHVHHIDNSAGHAHSELVNTKAGTYDITIEYCTDGGGGYVTDEATNASVAIAGHDTTVRWNDLRGASPPSTAKLPTHGVSIDSGVPAYCEREDGPQQCVGFDNAIYGNRITGYDTTVAGRTGHAVFFEAYWAEDWGMDVPANVWPDDQRTICGNEYTGPTHADPDAACPDWVPAGEGVGHTGGDSPW